MAKYVVVEVAFKDQMAHLGATQWSLVHKNAYASAEFDADAGILTMEPAPKSVKPRLRIPHASNIKYMVYGATLANPPTNLPAPKSK